jgi:myo-inositol 2-dehydrogenase/D-chiro-inositol 1-dehydrogenase
VDAIVIASPTPTHVDLTLAAVRKGKPVLCEKPVDLDLARAQTCQAQVAEAGGRVMIGFNRRFDPTFADIHRRVAAGTVGAVEHLSIVSRDPSLPPINYLATSGGIFRDMTIHDLDLARWFLGEIVEVQATGQNVIDPRVAQIGDIDAATLVLRSASGAVATVVNSRRCAFGYDQRIELFGAEGMLQAFNQAPTSIRTTLATSTDAGDRYQDFFLERYTDAYRRELAAFASAIAAGSTLTPSLDDGVAALELAEAAGVSLASRTAVRLPLGDSRSSAEDAPSPSCFPRWNT